MPRTMQLRRLSKLPCGLHSSDLYIGSGRVVACLLGKQGARRSLNRHGVMSKVVDDLCLSILSRLVHVTLSMIAMPLSCGLVRLPSHNTFCVCSSYFSSVSKSAQDQFCHSLPTVGSPDTTSRAQRCHDNKGREHGEMRRTRKTGEVISR